MSMDQTNQHEEPPDTSGAPHADDERQRRIDALQRLAGGQDASAVDTPPAPAALIQTRQTSQTRRRWPVWLAVVMVVAVVGAGGAAIFAHLRSATQPTHAAHAQPPGPITIAPASDLIKCPIDLAWSPDLQQIAVVGYSGVCPATQPDVLPGAPDIASALYQGNRLSGVDAYVALYDTHSGTREAVFSPDKVIRQTIHQQGLISSALTNYVGAVGESPDQYFAINYTHILWTPDHQRVIVTFTCFIPDGPPSKSAQGFPVWAGHITQGLLIVDPAGRHPQVLLHRGGTSIVGTAIWDLTTARLVASLPASAPFAFQPPALAYTWGANGALTPQTPLPASAAPASTSADLSPVGAPRAGAASFAIWQPGTLATALFSDNGRQRNLDGEAAYATSAAALSPDGRYLATSVGLAGLIVTKAGATSRASLADYGWQAAPLLPVRDAALLQAIALATQNGFAPDGDTLAHTVRVAWRPDGRVLAVSADTADHAVILFDCATGKQLKALTPPSVTASTSQSFTPLLEWSPDGQRLAYYDPTSGTLSLWSGAMLPA